MDWYLKHFICLVTCKHFVFIFLEKLSGCCPIEIFDEYTAKPRNSWFINREKWNVRSFSFKNVRFGVTDIHYVIIEYINNINPLRNKIQWYLLLLEDSMLIRLYILKNLILGHPI